VKKPVGQGDGDHSPDQRAQYHREGIQDGIRLALPADHPQVLPDCVDEVATALDAIG